MAKKISAVTYAVITALVSFVLTSCSGEELIRTEKPLPEGFLTVSTSENIVTVSEEVFATESGESYDVEAQPSASVTAVDGNILSAKALNGKVTNLTTSYGAKEGNRRTVTVVAYGKAENGEDLRSTTTYTQEVVEVEDEYTYEVNLLRERTDTTAQAGAENVKNVATYEVTRFKNGTSEKSWRVSLNKWQYLYSLGADAPVYTATNAEWQASVNLPEGDAKNSLGQVITLPHGTVSETNALNANVFENGKKTGSEEAFKVNVVTKNYYGDITFMSTANARVSAECTFQMVTMNGLTFTDSETGHTEVIFSAFEGTLSLAGTSYEDNPQAEETLTGSDGKVYNFSGDYVVSVNVEVNKTSVFTSKTKYHTYSWNGK